MSWTTKRWKRLSIQSRYTERGMNKGIEEETEYVNISNLFSSLQVLSIIKWRGPKSNELSSKFWKQVVYEMPSKRRETLSRRQVTKYITFLSTYSVKWDVYWNPCPSTHELCILCRATGVKTEKHSLRGQEKKNEWWKCSLHIYVCTPGGAYIHYNEMAFEMSAKYR